MPASILVVEDNEANLILIDYLLRAHGFTPLLARSGTKGLRVALKERPDVVLLDIRMAGIDWLLDVAVEPSRRNPLAISDHR